MILISIIIINIIMIIIIINYCYYHHHQEENTRGIWAILPPKCKTEHSKIKKEPLKSAIECNVKACSMLQIQSMGCEK